MVFAVDPDKLEKGAILITGFTGFGNVGFNVMNHLAETLELESVGFWGNSTWLHRSRLEAPITLYKEKERAVYYLVPRVPIPVTATPQQFWDAMMATVIQWDFKEYLFIGGLREVTRQPGDDKWAAYVATPQYEKHHGIKTTMGDHLPMIGPLASILAYGISNEKSVLALLVYCDEDEDEEAAQIALKELSRLTKMESPKPPIVPFDYSFVPMMRFPSSEYEGETSVDDDSDEMELGFDIGDLR